jgi:uncharacterized membrane protein YccC
MSAWIAIGAAVAVLGVGGCAADQPAVCDSLDAVQLTADHVRDTSVAENGLGQLMAELGQLRQDLDQLIVDAQSQFAAEAQALRASLDQLEANVTAARVAPDATHLSAVRAAVSGVRTSARQLANAMSGTC